MLLCVQTSNANKEYVYHVNYPTIKNKIVSKINLRYWESGYHKIKTTYSDVRSVTLPLNDQEAVTLKLVKYAMQNGVLFVEVG